MKIPRLTRTEIARLRQSHSPQPTLGRVLSGLLVAKEGDFFCIWDAAQTVGYLCSTDDPDLLLRLLALESASPGFVRTLITGYSSPFVQTPPNPAQPSFSGSARINLDKIKEKLK